MSRKIKLKKSIFLCQCILELATNLTKRSVTYKLNWQRVWLSGMLSLQLSILKEILPVYELVTSLANRNILPWNCLN